MLFNKTTVALILIVTLSMASVFYLNAQMQKKDTALQEAQTTIVELAQELSQAQDELANLNSFVKFTPEEWEAIQEEKSKLETEIANLKFSLSNDEIAFSFYEDRIKYLARQRSEENGSPTTADASSPWEIDLAFRTAMNNAKYEEAWALLTAEIHAACTLEWFVEKTEQAEEPPQFSETIFVDEAEGKNGKFAVIYVEETSIGHERLVHIMLPGNAGQWGVPLFSPTTCQ